MIEVIIKKYLDEHLDVPSFFEHQKDEPARFIILEKTSGAKQNHLLVPRLLFKVMPNRCMRRLYLMTK
ncbi:hypothetical protein SA111_00713 [Streptococcus agalactiae]|nr:hypothetical protein SA111_00713 [Streptococcus agalactiae]